MLVKPFYTELKVGFGPDVWKILKLGPTWYLPLEQTDKLLQASFPSSFLIKQTLLLIINCFVYSLTLN